MKAKAARRFNLLLLEKEYGTLAAIARATEQLPNGEGEGAVTASYLSQIKGGREMGDKVAKKLERLKPSLNEGWMDRPQEIGNFQEKFTDRGNAVAVAESKVSLPLISWVSAGLKEEAFDPYAPGAAEAWVDFDGPSSKGAFCLRVRGRSMESPDGREPTFPDGCLIAIEPRRQPKSGEYAVFRFPNSNEVTFKQYIISGAIRLLKPLNPDPEYPITVLDESNAQLVGTVFEKRIVTKY